MSYHTLYGAPLSLYTGRARSYLIKAGENYREQTPTTRHYLDEVVPAAGDRQGMPTLETDSGQVIRDGAAIIAHFEAKNGADFSPNTPLQNIVSLLFDVIGAEGLLRPAMHYRWDFPDQNLAFLKFHFESCIPSWVDRAAMAEKSMNQMRGAGQAFGAVPDNFEMIEARHARSESSTDEDNV